MSQAAAWQELNAVSQFLGLTVAVLTDWVPGLVLELDLYELLRLLSEARVDSSTPEPSCFEAPGSSEAPSLQVTSAPAALVLVLQPGQLPPAAERDTDPSLAAAAPHVAAPASAAVAEAVLASTCAAALPAAAAAALFPSVVEAVLASPAVAAVSTLDPESAAVAQRSQ